jgi:hypothetical protein
MRTTRLLGGLTAAVIAVVAPLTATIGTAAADDVNGVGTGTVGSTLLSVDVGTDGSVLSVDLLTDNGTSTIDPSSGAPSSSTSLTPFAISSTVVPGLGLTSPAVGTSSTGAEDAKTVSPALPSVPALSGSLTANLSSIVDSLGARSGLDGTLSNVGVAGGLLSIPSATVGLGTDAGTAKTTATRSISIPNLDVLDLSAVLEGLGMSLADLPLDDLLGLLDSLGVTLPDVTDPAAVVAAVDGAIVTLQGETGALTADLCDQVDGALDAIGGLAGTGAVADAADDIISDVDDVVDSTPVTTTIPGIVDDLLSAQALPVSCDSVTGTVQGLVDELQGVVGGVVGSVLATLGDTSLLSVQGIEIGVVADARSTVDQSVADVTGTIGSVKVGALTVPGVSGLDLTAATDVLAAAGDTISGLVGSVLGTVNADLANLVDVDVLDIDEVVAADGAYTKADAALTALRATITPPASLLATAAVTDPASGILDEVGATVPALAPVMSQLDAALGGLDLLTAPTTITVGRVTSSSAFRPVAATVGATPTGELPRTGGDAAVPAMAAVLVAGVALGIRRFVAAVVTP